MGVVTELGTGSPQKFRVVRCTMGTDRSVTRTPPNPSPGVTGPVGTVCMAQPTLSSLTRRPIKYHKAP